MKNLLAYLFATASAKLQPLPKLLLLASLLLASLTAQAQNKKAIDSLMRVYNTAKHDTAKILVLTSITQEYRTSKPDTCISIAQKALAMSEKIGFEKGKYRAYYNIGIANFNKGNYPLALEYFQKSLKIQEEIGDKQGIANSLNSIGIIYKNQGNYALALEHYQKSLKIAEEIGDKQGIANGLLSIGNIYRSQGNYPLALDYYQKSLKIAEEIGDKQGIASSLNSIGIIYKSQGNYPLALEYYQKSLKIFEEIGDKQGIANGLLSIGNIYYAQGNYPLALDYYQKSLKIKEEIGDKQGIANGLLSIGTIYYAQGNFPLALDYYQKNLKIREEIGDKKGIATSLGNIGNIYNKQGNYPLALEYYQKSLKIKEAIGDKWAVTYSSDGIAIIYQKQKDYDKSIEYAQKSLQIAQEIKAPKEIKMASKTLYESYKLKGDYVKALEYHELYKSMNDSLFNVDKAKKIANLEAKAEVERKEKAIELLNKDAEIQRIEIERQKNARLAIEKQAEADNLFALARQEKDKRKQDSLRSLAQSKQLEVEKHLIEEEKLKAESEKRKVALSKEKEAKEFQSYILYLVSVVLVLALVFAYFVYKSRQRQYKAKILARAQKDEIQQQQEKILQINEELNTTLTMVEQERQKSDTLLLNILPIEIANELKETGKTEVKYFESITVLFADVKGFSTLAAKISPQELIAELDATFTRMDEISMRFGLERIKTIGDCYMACGGLPHANKTHYFDTVLTALNIQHWMNEEYEKRNGNFWQVRLGAHTGDAVAGVIGKTKFAYDVWGNTVNLASRMESEGEVGKVNVTEQTFNLVKDYFIGDYREEVHAKNIGKVHAYFIDRLKPEFSQDELGFEPNERFWEVYKKL